MRTPLARIFYPAVLFLPLLACGPAGVPDPAAPALRTAAATIDPTLPDTNPLPDETTSSPDTPTTADSPYLYSIHFYGTLGGVGAESIMNGKRGYSIERTDVQNRTDWSGIRRQVQDAVNGGFTPIVRLDWAGGQTVPANGDYTGRANYAAKCREAVLNLRDLCHIWIIGNEMNLLSEGGIPASWYLTVYSSGDGNNAYTQIHSVQSNAQVLMGAVGPVNPDSNPGGPYAQAWQNYHYYLVQNAGAVDGFALHSYGSRNGGQPGLADYDPDPRDDTSYPNTDQNLENDNSAWGGSGQYRWFMGEIDRRFPTLPVYITETNSFLDAWPDTSYRPGWINALYEDVWTWNTTHRHKINGVAWYVYSWGANSDGLHFGLMREGFPNGQPARLQQARQDYINTTASTNFRSDNANNPDAYVYQLNTAASNLTSGDPNQIVLGPYVGRIDYWTGGYTDWGAGGPAGQADNWVLLQSRVFYVATAGTYQFRTTSDDGSWMVVDGQLVVSNPGLHGAVTAYGSKYLTVGIHWAWVKFFEAGGGAVTSYEYLPPGSTWQPIPERRGLYGGCLVYQLDTGASNLSSADMNAIVAGNYVNSMPWNGSSRNWGGGGPLGQVDNYIMMQPGVFWAATDGTYQFRTFSDDGSWLWVDGQIVVYNQGLHPGQERTGSVYLRRGWHTSFYKMFEATGGAYSSYHYKPPGASTWAPIPVH
ncbi:MAG TPA: PA14 domain-containing protein [Polyangia bacterium]|jgi:hypothetical protein|nr:PA14 domain-containing protein [Polyangia bacterium]